MTTANTLGEETSPYLRQHKDNPVHWQPWNSRTLARAKAENKPILLSIGYAACHWCHVMAHESFEDETTAGVMNELFVNIKVDREERPDLDAIYQVALNLLGESGGWPLTMFLTPEGEPFWGGTYFPSAAGFGRPAFTEVLRAIDETYRSRLEEVTRNAAMLRQAMARLARPAVAGELTMEHLDPAAGLVLQRVDLLRGGTVGAPKFPQPTLFGFLWRAHRRNGSPAFGDAVLKTLDGMCRGGIYDHLGGGFARYSTDAEWLVPHFEKMLYDNALLVELLSEVWRETRNPLYRARVEETIEWVLGEMKVGPGGAFASALDADSEGVEGKYYVWSAEEIDAVLGAESAAFKRAYDVTPGGNWEGRNILNRSAVPEADSDPTRLAESRRKLLEVRRTRVPPGRDDKVLADWNGMMIAALAAAGTVFERPEWLTAAAAAFSFVVDEMTVDGRLRHSWCAGQARHPAVLDDYANMARAALVLFEVTADRAYLDQALSWVEVVEGHYRDDEAGGYFLGADDTDDVIARSKTAADTATPSGNGLMVEVLARLYHLTGDAAYRRRAAETVRALAGDSPEGLVGLPTLLNGYELLERALQVVIIGDPDGALSRTVFDAAPPARVVSRLAPGEALPEGHPAAGKGLVDGRPTAYLCLGTECRAPITDGDVLRRQLSLL